MFLKVGFNSYVNANRIVSVSAYKSEPVKQLVKFSKDTMKLVDVTYGRRTRAVITMDSGHVILSTISPDTLAKRLNGGDVYVNEVD